MIVVQIDSGIEAAQAWCSRPGAHDAHNAATGRQAAPGAPNPDIGPESWQISGYRFGVTVRRQARDLADVRGLVRVVVRLRIGRTGVGRIVSGAAFPSRLSAPSIGQSLTRRG